MEKKYYKWISAVSVAVVVAAVAGFIFINDNEYYNDYRVQANCTNSALNLGMAGMAPLISQMMGLSNSTSNNNTISNNFTALYGAINNATMALEYQQKMLKNAKTDTEKKYAQTLILQSKALIEYLNIVKELETNTNGSNKTRTLMNQLEELNNQTQNYQQDLDAIKNNDTNFKKRLNDEDNKNHG